MQSIIDSITEWLKEVLVGGIMDHLSGMFDAVNQQVGDVAASLLRCSASTSGRCLAEPGQATQLAILLLDQLAKNLRPKLRQGRLDLLELAST